MALQVRDQTRPVKRALGQGRKVALRSRPQERYRRHMPTLADALTESEALAELTRLADEIAAHDIR